MSDWDNDMDFEAPEVLDLTGADTSGFKAMDPGSYNATVFEASWRQTKGREDAKLPAGTPMLNIQFRISDEPYENRRVFYALPIAPAGYEKEAKLKGNLVNFLTAIGYDEAKVTKAGFKIDLDDMADRECVVRVGKREYPKGSGDYQNDVKGVKPAGSQTSSANAGAASGLM